MEEKDDKKGLTESTTIKTIRKLKNRQSNSQLDDNDDAKSDIS
jgi:hypothetical protein